MLQNNSPMLSFLLPPRSRIRLCTKHPVVFLANRGFFVSLSNSNCHRSLDSSQKFSINRKISSSNSGSNATTNATTTTTNATLSISDAPTTNRDEKSVKSILLKAPYQKISQPGLFPWRHQEEPPARLVPGTDEYEEKGLLLGGNIVSSSPTLDALATEYLFLQVPWYNILFFRRAWEEDLADSMYWAFLQAIPAMLSNTFQLPFEKLANSDELKVRFEHQKGDHNDFASSSDIISDNTLRCMVHPDLSKLYHTAREFGTDSLRVRLEIMPREEPAQLVNLFAFPFLSRSNMQQRNKKYVHLLDSIATQGGLSREAMGTINEFMEDFRQQKVMESTVLCQVLIPCDEIFCVKDVETGRLVQGHADEQFRRVLHLVRFEKVVKMHWLDDQRGFFPFKSEPGDWQITDMDDLLEGNLLL